MIKLKRVGSVCSDLLGSVCSGQVGSLSSGQVGSVCAEFPTGKQKGIYFIKLVTLNNKNIVSKIIIN